MKTRMQRSFGVAAELAGERTVTENEKPAPQSKPESKGAKGDPYPTLPRRSLVRDRRPGE